jgi:hypothetical protein
MMETVYNAGDEIALLPALKYSEIIPTFFIRDDGNRLLIYMIDKNASGDVKNFPAYLFFFTSLETEYDYENWKFRWFLLQCILYMFLNCNFVPKTYQSGFYQN